MNTQDQLSLLSSSYMDLEPAEDVSCNQVSSLKKRQDPVFVSDAVLPNGKRIRLLKSLLTSACERNCFYCPFRAGRDFRRATFTPDEMANSFLALNRAGAADGIFLSSGIVGGGVRTQDRLIATAELLRRKHEYRGYLHLKMMPGAEKDQVAQAMRLADRVSVNLEAPNTPRLERLAPRKEFIEELLQPLRWVEEIRRSQPSSQGWNGYWPSMTTQFVVGAVGESDLELLQMTRDLYQKLRLRRAYFSAFRPIPDTPLENLPAASPVRQLRLYQASFLLRDYGFELEEMPFEDTGALPLHTDPKTAWAQVHLSDRLVEINRATRHELLRLPGIGPIGADRILAARRRGRLHSLDELRQIGVNPSRAVPFILMEGRRPEHQLSFAF